MNTQGWWSKVVGLAIAALISGVLLAGLALAADEIVLGAAIAQTGSASGWSWRMAMRPRVLLLDEVMAGLNPTEIMLDTLVDALGKVHHEGTTIFVVEQDVATAFDLASTGYVLENGRIVLAGPTAELRSNPHVKNAYLGL